MKRGNDKVVPLVPPAEQESERIVHRFDDGGLLEDTDRGLVLCRPRGGDDDAEAVGGEVAVKRTRLTHNRFVVAAESIPATGTDVAHGLVFEVGPRDTPRRYAVPASFAHKPGGALTQWLADRGVKIETKSTRELVRYIAQAAPGEYVTAYDRTGWQQNAPGVFVLGDRILGDPVGVFQPVATTGATVQAKGTLQQWLTKVAGPACSLAWWRWCLAVAFAGPILRLVEAEGFTFHANGASSKGKTVGGRVCASVWGCGAGVGNEGYSRSWASTANGIEGAAEAHNDLPLILDELGQADGRAVATVAYALANGAGKQRMKSDATMQRQKTWRVVALSTGEMTIEAKLAEVRAQHKAGMTVRIIELPTDGTEILDDLPTETVRALEAATMATYGTAGPAFVERLIADGFAAVESDAAGRLRERVKAIERHLVDTGDDTRHHRAARSFAVVAAAGELAVRFGLLPEQAAPLETARMLYRVWRDVGGGELGTDDHRRAASKLLDFIESKRGVTIVEPEGTPRGDRDGWLRDDRDVWLLAGALSAAIGSVPLRAFLDTAGRNGAFIRGEAKHLQSKIRTGASSARGFRFALDELRAWVHDDDQDAGNS